MPIKSSYRGIVRKGVYAATAAGPLGAFPGPFDAGALGGIWTTMLVAIAKKSGHELDGKFVTKFITTVGTSVAAYVAGSKMATYLFHLVPGAGTLAAMGISSYFNAMITYRFGASVSELFDKKDFDLGDAVNASELVIGMMCKSFTLGDIKGLLDIQRVAA